MLSVKDNFRETVSGGTPDHFVNQFEFFRTVREPVLDQMLKGLEPGKSTKSLWGVIMDWPAGQPGPVPNTRGDAKVIKEITRWRDYINESNHPRTQFTDEEWAPALEEAAAVRASGQFVAVSLSSGIFEKAHNLLGMQETMENFYLEPEAMHELIDYLTDFELAGAREVCRHMKPEILFHPDDFGSAASAFMSPEMFREFLLPAYKEIYGYWKSQGVEYIIHHSDCYAANLVPEMIEMGVDVWQGPVSENHIPELLDTYGDKLSYQGGINNSRFDTASFDPEEADAYVLSLCKDCGRHYFIPCLTQGGPKSVYPGVYDAISQSIRKASEKLF